MIRGVREGHRRLGDKGGAVANPACQAERMRMSGEGELRRAGAAEVGKMSSLVQGESILEERARAKARGH